MTQYAMNATIDTKKRACITLAVLAFMDQLQQLDDAAFAAAWATWTEHRWDDPAWSEGMVHRIPGVSGPAFISACQKIAIMAFLPGGIHAFGTWFMAKRSATWCASPLWKALAHSAYAVIASDYAAAVAATAAEAKTEPAKKAKRRTPKGA